MGSNVSENKPSELFPHAAAAIDVNLGSAISHDIMADAAYFFLKPRTIAVGSGAIVSISKVLRPRSPCASGGYCCFHPGGHKLVENPAADITLPAMCPSHKHHSASSHKQNN